MYVITGLIYLYSALKGKFTFYLIMFLYKLIVKICIINANPAALL